MVGLDFIRDHVACLTYNIEPPWHLETSILCKCRKVSAIRYKKIEAG